MTVPALAAAGAIVVGMANGAIAASFAVSGSTFKVSADELNGTRAEFLVNLVSGGGGWRAEQCAQFGLGC